MCMPPNRAEFERERERGHCHCGRGENGNLDFARHIERHEYARYEDTTYFGSGLERRGLEFNMVGGGGGEGKG